MKSGEYRPRVVRGGKRTEWMLSLIKKKRVAGRKESWACIWQLKSRGLVFPEEAKGFLSLSLVLSLALALNWQGLLITSAPSPQPPPHPIPTPMSLKPNSFLIQKLLTHFFSSYFSSTSPYSLYLKKGNLPIGDDFFFFFILFFSFPLIRFFPFLFFFYLVSSFYSTPYIFLFFKKSHLPFPWEWGKHLSC